MTTGFEVALAKRTALTERLIEALVHLPHAQAVSIVSSFMSLDHLEKVVEFQEGRS